MDPCCSYGRSPNVQLEFSLSNFRAIPVGSTWTNQQRRFGSNMFKWWSFLVSMFIFKSENSIKFSARHHYSCICRAWAIIEPHNVPGHTGTTHFLQLSPRNIQSSHREEKKNLCEKHQAQKVRKGADFFVFFCLSGNWKLYVVMILVSPCEVWLRPYRTWRRVWVALTSHQLPPHILWDIVSLTQAFIKKTYLHSKSAHPC